MLREAYARKLLDFRVARPLDRDWWMLVRWTTDWLEGQLLSEVCEVQYRLHVALLDYHLTQERFDLHWRQAQELQGRIRRHKLPWLAVADGADPVETAAMVDGWKRVFGDPDDPEVTERIRLTVKALQRDQE